MKWFGIFDLAWQSSDSWLCIDAIQSNCNGNFNNDLTEFYNLTKSGSTNYNQLTKELILKSIFPDPTILVSHASICHQINDFRNRNKIISNKIFIN